MWINRWNEIARRIEALTQSTSLFFQSIPNVGADHHAVSNKHIIEEAKEIWTLIGEFNIQFKDILSPGATKAIERFLNSSRDTFEGASGIAGVQGACLSLISVRAALEYHIKGGDSIGKSITERALEHLKRSIVVDKDYRKKWQKAFKAGEIECEKLGSIHLLQHGIWAFKINAIGERTDLVFNEPLDIGTAERTAPSAIVLTEWKRANSNNDIESQLTSARRQVSNYSQGSLSDLELSETRYLIIVTEKEKKIPIQVVEDNIQYRNVIIAVNPDVPSIEAKKNVRISSIF